MKDQSLGLLRALMAFLETLPPDEIKQLAAGRAELRLVPIPKTKKPAKPAPKPLSKAELAGLRAKIEKQKAAGSKPGLNWLNRHRKEALWQLINSYNFSSAALGGLSPSKPKGVLIAFIRLRVLGLATNQGSIGDIVLG